MIEKIVHAVLACVFKTLKKELTSQTAEDCMQFARFGIVGLSNTAVSYALYTAGLLLFQKLGLFHKADYLIAQAAAFVLSVLWSFYWNSKTVFVLQEGQARPVLRALARTFVSYAFTGLFLGSILLFFWVEVAGVSEFIAPAINLVVTVPLNFIINKFWAFKRS